MPQDYADLIFGPALQNQTQPDNYADAIFGPAPSPTPLQQVGQFLKPIGTTVGTVFEFLNRPSKAIAETALALQKGEEILPGVGRALSGESSASFEDVLGNAGMEDSWKRTAAGLGLDILLDPLNVVGGLPFKAAKGASVALGAEKALDALKATEPVQAIGSKFSPFFGLPEDYTTARRLLNSEIEAKRADAVENALARYKGKVTPEEAKQITLALDKPGGSTGSHKLDTLMREQRTEFEAQKAAEISAKVLDPAKAVPDYVTYLFKGPLGEETREGMRRTLSSKNPFAKKRDLVSIEQALYLGAEPHIAKIAAVRKAAGDRAIAVSNFFQRAVKDFSVDKAKSLPEMREVTIAGDMPIKEIFQGRYFSPEIAADLEKISKVGESRDFIDDLFRVSSGVWKSYATAANPGFHLRNLASNIFNSWLGGMGLHEVPIRYAEAAGLEKGVGNAIGKYSAQEVAAALRPMGVTGAGHGAFGEHALELERLTAATKGPVGKAIQSVNPASRFNLWLTGGRTAGNQVENLSRKALFLDQLHKGKSMEEAAMHVRKYLFDYSEITDFERKTRDRAIPFYTWLRKNLPLQIEGVATQPQKYAHVGKVAAEIEESTGDERVPVEERPDWMQKANSLQLPQKTGRGEKVFFTPDLPFADLNNLPTSQLLEGQPGEAASTSFTNLLSMLNPALKVPAELALNREAFTGRDIVNPDLGPEQIVKAPAHIALVANVSPKLAEQLGMTRGVNREGEEQWMMPARAVYLANQMPFFVKLGRVLGTQPSEEQGEFVGGLQPRQLGWFGVSLSPMDQLREAQEKAAKYRDRKTQIRGLSRQRAMSRPVQPNQLESAVLQMLLGGGME